MFKEKISETIEAGAPSIKYNRGDVRMGQDSGDQRSLQIAAEIWDQMEPQQKVQFQGFEQFYKSGIWKQILAQLQQDQQQEAGQGISSQMPREMMEEQVSMSERMGAQYGGRIGYDRGRLVEGMAEGIEKVGSGGSEILEKIKEGVIKGGKDAASPFIDESISIEKIKNLPEWSRDATTVPGGIETIKEKETMKMAGGGARGRKAQMVAEDIAQERYGKEFYDLSQALQLEIYSEALDFIDSGGD